MDDDGERPLGNFLVPGFLEMLNELARELGQPDIAKSPEDRRIRLLLDLTPFAKLRLATLLNPQTPDSSLLLPAFAPEKTIAPSECFPAY